MNPAENTNRAIEIPNSSDESFLEVPPEGSNTNHLVINKLADNIEPPKAVSEEKNKVLVSTLPPTTPTTTTTTTVKVTTTTTPQAPVTITTAATDVPPKLSEKVCQFCVNHSFTNCL